MANNTYAKFQPQKSVSLAGNEKSIDPEILEMLVKVQTDQLIKRYSTDCLNATQLQKVLGVGKDNVYDLLKKEILPVKTEGRRKVVSVVAVAYYLVSAKK